MDWVEHGLPDDGALIALARSVDIARHGERTNTPWGDVNDPRLVGWFGTRFLAAYLGVPMDTTVHPHGGDHRINLIGPRGARIDVITRTQSGDWLPDLTLRCATPERRDLALALVIWRGHLRQALLGGWLWEPELRAKGRRKVLDAGSHGGECFLASVRDLHPMETLRTAGPDPPPEQPRLF